MSEVYKFKAMSQVETLEEPTETTTVLAVEDGAVRQVPAAKLGGGGGGGAGNFLVTVSLDPETGNVSGADKTFAEIMVAINAGAFPVLRVDTTALNGSYAYFPLAQMMPEMGVVFAAFFSAGFVAFICTPDDQWVMQEMGE